MSDRKIVLPGDIPIVGQGTVFVVCARGHVNEAPAHATVMFKNEDGSVDEAVLCGRCQFDLFVAAAGGVLLPRTTTRKEAEWKAKEMKDAVEGHRVMPVPTEDILS